MITITKETSEDIILTHVIIDGFRDGKDTIVGFRGQGRGGGGEEHLREKYQTDRIDANPMRIQMCREDNGQIKSEINHHSKYCMI